MIFDPTMDITREELDTVLGGLADDGSISKEAEAVILKRMEEAKAHGGYLIGEFKRQFRAKVSAEEGKKIADVIDRLW